MGALILCLLPSFPNNQKGIQMPYTEHYSRSDDFRREELVRNIERAISRLTLQELEALYYDMSTKNYINEGI